MTAVIYQLRDYHLKRLEKDAAKVMSQVTDYAEVAKLGGPGGVDDLIFADTAPSEYVAPDKDPA